MKSADDEDDPCMAWAASQSAPPATERAIEALSIRDAEARCTDEELLQRQLSEWQESAHEAQRSPTDSSARRRSSLSKESYPSFTGIAVCSAGHAGARSRRDR